MIAKISDIADVQGGMVLSRKEAKSPEPRSTDSSRPFVGAIVYFSAKARILSITSSIMIDGLWRLVR